MNDQCDDEAENNQRSPEDPDGLRDTIAGDIDRICCVHPAEHHDGVAAHGHVLPKVRCAEKVDQVVSDGRIVLCAYAAEEDNNVVLRLVRDMYVAKEHHHVVIDVALGVDAAEKADSIVNTMPLGHVDVAAKLHGVLFGARRAGGQQERRSKQQDREQPPGHTLSHVDPHAKLYAESRGLVPGNRNTGLGKHQPGQNPAHVR
jgi:hypothetical protein